MELHIPEIGTKALSGGLWGSEVMQEEDATLRSHQGVRTTTAILNPTLEWDC